SRRKRGRNGRPRYFASHILDRTLKTSTAFAIKTVLNETLRIDVSFQTLLGSVFRWRKASYKTTPVATDTFSVSILPCTGIRIRASQRSRTRRCKPAPSPPRTTAEGRVQSHSV